jgi:uncharacterized protein (TIGR02466 family)
MNFEITPLFATPVYHGDSGIELFEDEIEFIKDMQIIPAKNNSVSSDMNVLTNEIFSRCRNICEQHLKNFSDVVIDCEQTFFITDSWIAKTQCNESHHNHFHPHSIISGVLYLQSYSDSGNINFHHKSSLKNYFHLNYSIKNYNVFNSDKWSYSPKTGEILLFPSWLSHSVDENKNSLPRIILGFNTFVKGKFGGNDYSANLTL